MENAPKRSRAGETDIIDPRPITTMMSQEGATPLSLTTERLPQDVAAGVARDVQLMNLRDRVRCREMANATWWKGPIFDTWLRVAYYEREFPGSTSQGGVHWEP